MRNGFRLLIALGCGWAAYELIIAGIDAAPFLTDKYGLVWERVGLFLLNHIYASAVVGAMVVALLAWCFSPAFMTWFVKKN